MTAAYRLKGIGWFALVVAVALGLYLISLRVAAERKLLDNANARVAAAARDIRALETEFDTRANLAQLEKWNGDTLGLAAPTAAQFARDDAALASLDPRGPLDATVKMAALVVPSRPVLAVAPAAPAPDARIVVAPPVLQTAAADAAADAVVPAGRGAPLLARLAEAARGDAAVARVRPLAVAMLDRKLLSDNTFGDIMAGARAEAGRR